MYSHSEVPAALFRHRGVLWLWIFTDRDGKTCDFSIIDSECENAEKNHFTNWQGMVQASVPYPSFSKNYAS